MISGQIPRRAGTYARRADDWDRNGWTGVPNRMARDEVLDWDAKGAYVWIASHSELFELSAEKLAAAGPRGRNHAYEMLGKLEEQGWLTRHRYRAVDGRGTVHLWVIHGNPVPPEQRTFRPSKAKRKEWAYGDSDGPDTPQLPDARELEETAGQVATPEGPGVPSPASPGTPGRSGPDRPGVPYMEEKTTREDQEEGGPDATPAAGPDSPRPPAASSSPPIDIDLEDPDTWLCRQHAADPVPAGEYRPPCGPCGAVRKRALRERDRREEARKNARAAAHRACQARGWCDPGGWVLDPYTGDTTRPAIRCDHLADPREFIYPPGGSTQPESSATPPVPAQEESRPVRTFVRKSVLNAGS